MSSTNDSASPLLERFLELFPMTLTDPSSISHSSTSFRYSDMIIATLLYFQRYQICFVHLQAGLGM